MPQIDSDNEEYEEVWEPENQYMEGWLCQHGWTKEGVDCPQCNPEGDYE